MNEYIWYSPTGSLVKEGEITVNGKLMSMAIMELATGPGIYLLHGAVKDNQKGYYFQIQIGPKIAIELNESNYDEVFSFNFEQVPIDYLNIIEKVLMEDIPEKYFRKYESPWTQSDVDGLKRTNDNRFPSTF
jgi:hypothetical protein